MALESLGASVTRVAARNSPDELVDEADIQELDKTVCVVDSKKGLLKAGFEAFKEKPGRFLSAIGVVLSLSFYDNCRVFKNLVYLLEAAELLRICRKNNVDHVHAHFATNSTSVAMLCYLLGGPKYSFTVHGPEEFDKPIQISLTRKIENSAFVVAITSYCRSQLFRWCSFAHWDKIQEVHCAVDEQLLDAPAQEITQSNAFISIGRLCEQKGQMLMLKAMAQLKQQGADFRLDLVGDGEMRGEIESFIRENELSENVRMHGWQSSDQIKDLLDQSTALILPSFAEGLPVVIMEAYARSKPVLSTYIAGIPELVQDDSGWLVPAGNVELLTETLKKIIDSSLYQLTKLGKKGRQKVGERHNSVKEAEKLMACIAKFSQGKGGA